MSQKIKKLLPFWSVPLYIVGLFFALQLSVERMIGQKFFTLLASTSTMAWKIFLTTNASLRLLLSLLVLGLTLILFLVLTGRRRLSLLLLTTLVVIVGVAEYQFLKNLNVVFSLDYLKRVHEFFILIQSGFFSTPVVLSAIVGILLLLSGVYFLWKKEQPISRRTRLRYALTLLMGAPLLASPAILGKTLELFGLDRHFQTREVQHVVNGVPGALLVDYYHNLKRWRRIPPDGYSEEAIRGMMPQITPVPIPTVSGGRRVRIILYLMESYWDPVSTFPESISPDPLQPFKEMRLDPSRSFRGRIIVPVFGGGTIQTEFEVLTGLSASGFGELVYPSLQSPVESLAEFYTRLDPPGKALFMTAHEKTFYNRNIALPYFGVHHFIEDDDMACSDIGGTWYARTEKCLITETIDLMNRHDAPEVLMLEGAQNHADYFIAVNERPFAFSEAVPESDRPTYLIHVNHLRDLSEQAVRLARFVDTSKEPTILFAYGDHLPSKFSFLVDGTPKPADWRTTPFLLHANFPLPADVLDWLKRTPLPATYEMNAIIQQAAGIPLSPVGRTVLSWRKDCPPKSDPAKVKPECAQRHRLLTYDMVLGRRYASRAAGLRTNSQYVHDLKTENR